MQTRFNFIFALKSIVYFRKRIVLVLFGIIFALSLLFANSIWEDTSEILVINELVDNTDYLVTTTSFLPGKINEIIEYLPEDDNIESFDVSILSNAIFNFEDKDEEYRYFPLNNQQDPNSPVDVSNAIITNLGAMEKLESIFTINGSMPNNYNEILLSRDLVVDLQQLINIEIVPGTKINVSIAKKFPFTDIGEFQLKHFQPSYYFDFVVAGIIEYNGAASLTQELYTESVFNRVVIFPLTEETFTLLEVGLMDRNSLIANLMISIKMENLVEFGIENLESYLFNFRERLKSRFWFSVNKAQTRTVEDLKSEFVFSFNSAAFYYPLIILSLLLTHYTIGLLIEGREDHYNILRLRGANDKDIIRILAVEFSIIAIIAFVLGTPLSIVLASLIPGLRPNGTIDIETVRLFFQKMQLEFTDLYIILLVVISIYLISVIYHTNNLIQKSNSQKIDLSSRIGFIMWIRIIAFLILSPLLIYGIVQINKNSELIAQNFDVINRNLAIQGILILCLVWLLSAQFLAEGLLYVLSKIGYVYDRFLPDIAFYIRKNFQRKNPSTKILSFYLIFLFSLLIFSSTLYSTYDNYKIDEKLYNQGADVRIQSYRTYSNFTNIIENISGIKQVTPIMKSTGYIASTEYTVYSIDPMSYLEVGYWNFANGSDTPKNLMNMLDVNQRGIIISRFLALRLGYNIGQEIILSSFLGNYATSFEILGFLDSAPGIGLSGFSNPELNQFNRGWLILNLNFTLNHFKLDFTELFLASLSPGANITIVVDELTKYEEIELINPDPINRKFIGLFVGKFLPFPRAILLFSGIISFFISIILIVLVTDFIITKRKREYALLIAIGGTKNKVDKLIMSELLIVSLSSLALSTLFGYLISYMALLFFVPFTLKKLVVPLEFSFNTPIVFGLFILIMVEMTILISHRRKRILHQNIISILLNKVD